MWLVPGAGGGGVSGGPQDLPVSTSVSSLTGRNCPHGAFIDSKHLSGDYFPLVFFLLLKTKRLSSTVCRVNINFIPPAPFLLHRGDSHVNIPPPMRILMLHSECSVEVCEQTEGYEQVGKCGAQSFL